MSSWIPSPIKSFIGYFSSPSPVSSSAAAASSSKSSSVTDESHRRRSPRFVEQVAQFAESSLHPSQNTCKSTLVLTKPTMGYNSDTSSDEDEEMKEALVGQCLL